MQEPYAADSAPPGHPRRGPPAKAVSAEELARRFGVSLETIRRDLRGLRDRGLLERVYGGALSVRSTEGDFATRSTLHAAGKLAIAQLAATLVEPEDTLVIDIGTTALEVARALPESFRGRVLTNSVPAAMALADREEIELLLCGGQVRHGDAACFGAQAEAFFADFYADKAFLGSGRRARPGRADRLPPARGGHPAHDHRARGRLLRPGRLEQARRDRRAPGLPAQPRHRGPHRPRRQCRGHRGPCQRRLHRARAPEGGPRRTPPDRGGVTGE